MSKLFKPAASAAGSTRFSDGRPLHCQDMMTFTELATAPSDPLAPSLTSSGWQWPPTWPASRAPPVSTPSPTCAATSPGAREVADDVVVALRGAGLLGRELDGDGCSCSRWAGDGDRAVDALNAIDEAGEPGAVPGVSAARAVVADLEFRHSVADGDAGGPGMLDRVGQRLGDHEVRGGFHVGGQSARTVPGERCRAVGAALRSPAPARPRERACLPRSTRRAA
jgi:hypothetical protein